MNTWSVSLKSNNYKSQNLLCDSVMLWLNSFDPILALDRSTINNILCLNDNLVNDFSSLYDLVTY